ncbi:hypothetical protein SASPL_131020 [Salvia splendens]|uniref:Uncharacterized protein n=1 Tax=Salvia splendens TaxID=180675 RepID=A0A8X8X9B6_SALSN|nr:hypothetical protein SASPL_131020 [Salvia splendens]
MVKCKRDSGRGGARCGGHGEIPPNEEFVRQRDLHDIKNNAMGEQMGDSEGPDVAKRMVKFKEISTIRVSKGALRSTCRQGGRGFGK